MVAGTGVDGLNAAGENQFGLNPALEGTEFGGAADRNQNGVQNNNPIGGANNTKSSESFGRPARPVQSVWRGAARATTTWLCTAGRTGTGRAARESSQCGSRGWWSGSSRRRGGSGAGDGASLANPANAVLAQQLDPQQTGAGGQQQQPIQQGVQNPENAGNAAARQNNGTGQQTRSGNPYDPRENSERQRQAEQNANPLSNPTGAPFVASIGVLQVGPDGTGTVQGQLEGVAVRNLAGMNVIVQSTNWQGNGGAAVDPRRCSGSAGQRTATAGASSPPRTTSAAARRPTTRAARTASDARRSGNCGDGHNSTSQ